MRMMVIDWMFDVSQDLQCRGHEDVFLLSCNVMDSFLSSQGGHHQDLLPGSIL